MEIDPDLTVDADPERLEQILVNLIGNAARHGVPPIVVDAGAAGDRVDISVRDHGTGVPADRRDALFERYTSESGAVDSVGLGLWIVRELAFVLDVAEASASLTRERPNLDFSLAAVARVLRLPAGAPLTIFAIGRTIGWIGHAIEQYATAQLIRPRAKYVGAMPIP